MRDQVYRNPVPGNVNRVVAGTDHQLFGILSMDLNKAAEIAALQEAHRKIDTGVSSFLSGVKAQPVINDQLTTETLTESQADLLEQIKVQMGPYESATGDKPATMMVGQKAETIIKQLFGENGMDVVAQKLGLSAVYGQVPQHQPIYPANWDQMNRKQRRVWLAKQRNSKKGK